MKDNTEVSFSIILHAGNATNACIEAMQKAKKGDYEEADQLLKEATVEINQAHQVQKDLLVDVANNKKMDVDIILVHAQDHLTSAMTLKIVAEEIIELYKTR